MCQQLRILFCQDFPDVLKVGTVGHWKLLEKEGKWPSEQPIQNFKAEEVVVAKQADEGEDESGNKICLCEDWMIVSK